MNTAAPRFSDLFITSVDRAPAPACVGIDPVLDRLPEEVRALARGPAHAAGLFSLGVIEAVAGIVPAVKLQAACFERYGAPGWRALADAAGAARCAGLLVILDAKRGDIGISARHYAAAARSLGAHAITANAYLGPETVRPYLDAGLGVFILVRTSNDDSDAVQGERLLDGRSVAELMADLTAALGEGCIGEGGLSDVGAVVAATKPRDAASLRARMPDTPLLVPGFGAQGGSPETIRGLARPAGPPGLLVSASRSIIYPQAADGRPWRCAIADAARAFASELAGFTPPPTT